MLIQIRANLFKNNFPQISYTPNIYTFTVLCTKYSKVISKYTGTNDFSNNFRYDTYTVNQLLFAVDKILRDSWEPHCCAYFWPQTSPCHMVVITKWVCIRLTHENWLKRISLSPVNRKIMSSLLKVRLPFVYIMLSFIVVLSISFVNTCMYIDVQVLK